MTCTPTVREAIADAVQACEALVHAMGPDLAPADARALRSLAGALASLLYGQCLLGPVDSGTCQALAEVGQALDLTTKPVLAVG